MRKVIFFVLVITLILLCFGCANPQESRLIPSYKYVVGVSQANLIEPWRIALYEEIKIKSADFDDMRFVFTDAAGESERQIGDVNHLLELGIDLLIISPNNADKLQDVIASVHKDIPVIVLDREVEGGDYSLYIGSDNKLIGMLAGEYTAQLLGDDGGIVLEITGNKDSPPVQALSQGFAEAIAKNPQITVVDTLDADWLRDIAEMRMKDYLIKADKVDVVFAHNDAMAYGAYIAAQELRVNGIRFIGVDGLDSEGKKLVDRGVLAGTFFRRTGGSEAVNWARRILEGENIPSQQIILEPVPIVSDFKAME